MFTILYTRLLQTVCGSPAARLRAGSKSAAMLLAAMLVLCGAAPAFAQNLSLGTAATFGVLAGSAVTNTGPTVVNGSVGTFPGTSITGFPPGSITPGSGSFHSADAVAQQAEFDLGAAYTDAATRVCGAAIAGGVLGGLVLTPGVYCMDAGSLTGKLTLDGPGVYIFQMASSLITAPGASVELLNGASACGVWWQVTSSATIATTTSMVGNILALSSISLQTGATLNGRALARNALVSLDSSTVSACSGGPFPPVPPPGLPGAGSSGAVPVPALSDWTLVAVAALIGSTAYWLRRRRAR